MLTKKQKNLLIFINKKIRSSGISPSYEEMKNSLNLKSKSGIHRLISALEERGFVKRLNKKENALVMAKGLFGLTRGAMTYLPLLYAANEAKKLLEKKRPVN